MDQVRWAVIGAGGIARRRTIPEGILSAPNAELVAVYDPVDCTAIAKQFNTRACVSEQELLAQEIDAVYIATPTHLHFEQFSRTVAEHRHVLCEKPLGLDVTEASQMVAIADAAGVKLATGLMMRFSSQHKAAVDLVRSGQLGKPSFGRAQLSCWYPPMTGAWRQDPELGGGGSLADMGSHCIDLLEMFFGRTTKVMAMTGHLVHDYASEDTATAILSFADGAFGVVDCLFNVPDASCRNRLEIYGSQGSILAEGTIGQDPAGQMTLIAEQQAGGYDAPQQRGPSAGQAITPEPVNLYRAQIEAFSQAILTDTPPPVSGHDGAWNVRVLQACYESARSGSAVEL